jgi:hypothetical protein
MFCRRKVFCLFSTSTPKSNHLLPGRVDYFADRSVPHHRHCPSSCTPAPIGAVTSSFAFARAGVNVLNCFPAVYQLIPNHRHCPSALVCLIPHFRPVMHTGFKMAAETNNFRVGRLPILICRQFITPGVLCLAFYAEKMIAFQTLLFSRANGDSILRASPSVGSVALPEGLDTSFETSFLRPIALVVSLGDTPPPAGSGDPGLYFCEGRLLPLSVAAVNFT